MERQGIQVAIYPTPAPIYAKVHIETLLIDELEEVCHYLAAEEVVKGTIQQLNIRRHFRDLFAITDLTYHVEILTENIELPERLIWEKLHLLFPQFAWVRWCQEERTSNKLAYYLEFVPLVHRKSGFPFEISLQESVMQQFNISGENAVQLAEAEILQIVEASLEPGAEMSSVIRPNEVVIEEAPEIAADVAVEEAENVNVLHEEAENVAVSYDEIDSLEVSPKAIVPSLPVEDKPAKVTKTVESDLLYLEEAFKREKSSKERLRNANEQLELLVEKLELSLLSNSVQYFEERETDDSEWYKRIRVDLREYTLLIQKAKYLEQMWQLNEKLVNQAEKMMISDNQLIYERNQVTQIKSEYTSAEIQFVLYDCQLIESRSKVSIKPWLGKPHVKMLKMDYDNLVNKAAYFDLLQGESFALERAVKEKETAEKASKEDD